MASTPAIAVLEREGVSYRLHEYELGPGAEAYGLEAAEKLYVPLTTPQPVSQGVLTAGRSPVVSRTRYARRRKR